MSNTTVLKPTLDEKSTPKGCPTVKSPHTVKFKGRLMQSTLSKFLPYALLAFVAIAGWSMGSTMLLGVVVLGTVGVAVGTALGSRPNTKSQPKL